MMKIVDITREMQGFDEIEHLQTVSFPPEENFPMEQLLRLAELPNTEYKSFWEGDQLCGLLHYNVGDTMMYLFYIAIPASLQSQGYGTKLLRWLKDTYPGKAIVGNTEPLGIGADNEEQRIRRMDFYWKNGFHKIDCQLLDDTGLYDIISSADPSEAFDTEEFMRLLYELEFEAINPRIV